MPKKEWTDEERAAFGAKMKAKRLEKEQQRESAKPQQEVSPSQAHTDQAPQSQAETVTITQDQYQALMARLDAVDAAKTETVRPSDNGFDQYGKPQGVIQRYSLDPAHYSSPLEQLYNLEELRRFGLKDNYEMTWDVDQTIYETKYGTSMADPKFTITLKKKMYDGAGLLTDKRIIVQTGVFFEDPAASVKEAVALGLPIDKANTPEFLSQMRFLRYKQWLLDVFNPNPPTSTKARITPTVIDGKVYEIEDSSVVV